jgi:hypothetical protein
LTGSYLLASREAYSGHEARIFSCRSRSVSPQMAVLQAPVKGEVGERAALKLDTLGLLRASINRVTPDGFVADLLLSRTEIAAIAGRIDWLKQKFLRSLPDRRESKRWLPRDSHSSLIMADRREVDCFIIDVSSTGVAVSADAMPDIGHPVVVGTVLGRVTRRLDAGFAVQFLSPHDPMKIESLLVPPRESKRDLLAQALAQAEASYATAQAAQPGL